MRVTFNGALVLSAIDTGAHYGFEIMEKTNLPSGTVYPILRRFEARRLLRSRWEKQSVASAAGRPRRRLYELSGAGVRALDSARERFARQSQMFTAPRAGENS